MYFLLFLLFFFFLFLATLGLQAAPIWAIYIYIYNIYIYIIKIIGTVSSKITLVILFQNFDKQKKSNARIEMYG